MTDIEKMTGETKDLVADNIAQLKALFPEVMTEGKINFDTLQELLGAEVEKPEEHYNFTWHGKRAALRLAQTPSLGTLRPVRDESTDWDNTQNVFIEGDNLEVLKLLQKSYFGKVKMIYIDPPYNTGKDFVYKDDLKDNIKNYRSITGQLDEEGRRTSTNTNDDGRYHTNWLNMMYPRLRLARNLMRDDGVIFISIDEHEQANLRKLCDEVFGEENFLTTLIWNKQHSQQQGMFKKYHEHVIVFAKNSDKITAINGGEGFIEAGALKKISRGNPESEFTFPAGTRFDAPDGTLLQGTFGVTEKVTVVKGVFSCKDGKTTEELTLSAGWTQKNQMEKWFKGEETFDTREQKVLEFYFNSTGKLKCRKERGRITPSTFLPKYGMVSDSTKFLSDLMGANVFSTPKPVKMIEDFINWFTDDDDIILDFFAGSCTTAHAVMDLNATDGGLRKFICVQLPEIIDKKSPAFQAGYKNIADISKERIKLAGKKIKEAGGLAHTPDLGFKVFRLDDSNLKRWDPYPDHEDIEPNLADAVDYLKDDREEDDFLFELLLKCGLDLAVPIETRTVAGNKQIYSIGLGKLVVCLDTDITTEVAEAIAELNAELKPEDGMRVILRDEGFKDDCAKTNSIITLKTRGIKDVKSL